MIGIINYGLGNVGSICNMLKKEVMIKSFYKTIFTIIKYEDNIVFMGNICFDGIK